MKEVEGGPLGEPGRRAMSVDAATFLLGVALLGILRFNPTFLPLVLTVYWADVAILALGLLWFLNARRLSWMPAVRWTAGSGLLALVLIVIAILGSSLFARSAPPGEENIIQAVRFTVYGITTLLLADLAVRSDVDWHGVARRLVVAALLVNVGVAMIQLLNPPGLGPLVYALWGEDKLRSLASGYPRVYGTYFNANWCGVFVAWCVTYLVATWRTGSRTPLRQGLLLSAALFLLIVTGSRTGILATAAGATVAGLAQVDLARFGRVQLRRRSGFTGLVVVAAAIAVIVVAVRRLDLSRFATRFVELAMLLSAPGEAEVGTLESRFRAWGQGLELFWSAPIFGVGGSTETTGIAPHNGYIAMLAHFGVVGAAGLSLFVVCACILARRTLGGDPGSRGLHAWFFGFTAALSVAMMAGDFIYTSRLIFLWLLVLAFAVGQAEFARSRNRLRRLPGDPAVEAVLADGSRRSAR